jgi:GntR family transcriptional regulator
MTSLTNLTRTRGERPLYAQVAERIASDIDAGGLQPGDRIASEPELVRHFRISRSTAGKAVEVLERAGVVRREQGRGTFVQRPPLLHRQPQLGSFSAHVRAQGHEPAQRLVLLGDGAQDPLATWFPPGSPLLRIVRVRLVDDEPVGVHRTVLLGPEAARAGVSPETLGDAGASLYELLERAGIEIADAEEHLQAIAADEEDAALLAVAPRTPLMRVLRVSRDAEGRQLEVVDARYVGERFDYRIALGRSSTGGAGGPPYVITGRAQR